MIRIADNLTLPLDIVTESIAILAIKRAGKSYTARKLAEQLYHAHQQVVIVDPKGDWWGIRSAADGKSPGLPIVILGGEHGDIPLEVGSGELVAKMVGMERVSVLIDLSAFRKHEVATFMTAFLENLYRLHAKEEYRTAMMLMVDEADAIAPQRPYKGEERMLGAAEDIVRRGGQRGIGITLITQRAAVLNKNVLSQCGIMVFLRMLGLQDIEGTDDWIKKHGQPEQKALLMAALPSLPRGTAWVWAPGWPDEKGIFKQVKVRSIETFDSGATPKPGERRVMPKTVADVDLEAFRREMAATIERAKAEDPRELRKQITQLQRELQSRPTAEIKEIEVPAVSPALIESLSSIEGEIRKAFGAFEGQAIRLERTANEIKEAIRIATNFHTPSRSVPNRPISPHSDPRPVSKPSFPSKPLENGLTGPEQRILDAIAWLESIGNQEPDQVAVAFLAGYTYGGGAFNNPKGKLCTKGLIQYQGGNRIALTENGRHLANAPEAPLTTEDLHEHILRRLPGPERKILRVVLKAHPKAIDCESLARAAGYEPRGGAFNNPRGRLRSLGLIEYPEPGMVKAYDILFL